MLIAFMAMRVWGNTPADSVKVYLPVGHYHMATVSPNDQLIPEDIESQMVKSVSDTPDVPVLEPEFTDPDELVDLPDSVFFELDDFVQLPDTLSTEAVEIEVRQKSFHMALKTNMLYDALLIPNFGVEFGLGRQFSVYGEWMYAWWNTDRHHRYWRIYGGDLGLRWWFGRKAHAKPLTGHHLGIYGGILTFDFEVGKTVYLGGNPGGTLWDRWLVNSGIEYGYSLPIGKHLNIDFSIGLGYMGGNYIKYYPFDNDYYFDKEYKMHYFGPTKAEISLVWLIGRGNTNVRKGGAR